MVKKLNLTIVVIVVIVVFGVLGSISLLNDDENTLSVIGNSEMKFEPDTLAVYVNIETRSESAEEAEEKNSIISEEVLGALLNVNANNIRMQGFNVRPEYSWENERQEIVGYVASQQLKVVSKDFDILGRVVDAVIDNGGLISYINFELSSPKMNEYKAIVLEEASKDAKVKAEAVAKGLGKKVGGLVSVSTSDYDYKPYPLYMAEDSAVVGSEEIKSVFSDGANPSELTVRGSVNVVYKIR